VDRYRPFFLTGGGGGSKDFLFTQFILNGGPTMAQEKEVTLPGGEGDMAR
jgi:hypothetical protein